GRSDSECKSHHGDQCEAGLLGHHSETVAKVLQNAVHEDTSDNALASGDSMINSVGTRDRMVSATECYGVAEKSLSVARSELHAPASVLFRHDVQGFVCADLRTIGAI